MLHIMSKASDIVLNVINDILDTAKLEARKLSLNNCIFDLYDLFQRTIEIFGECTGTKGIELIMIFDPNQLPRYVASDPTR